MFSTILGYPDNLRIAYFIWEMLGIKGSCVNLDTMSWQAPDFYKKNGYEVIGVLPDIPEGREKYLLMKAL